MFKDMWLSGEEDNDEESESGSWDGGIVAGWNSLSDDSIIHVFSLLNNCDRATLSQTCRRCRILGASPFLWNSLDTSLYTFNVSTAATIASRCVHLRNLKFGPGDTGTAEAINHLQTKKLREISSCNCRDITDDTVSAVVAQHQSLESIQLLSTSCLGITGRAIESIAFSCSKLKKLRLSFIRIIEGHAINALATHCPHLADIAFIRCRNIDEAALGNLQSVQFLSIAWSRIKFEYMSETWSKLSKLTGLDISGTDICFDQILKLLSSSKNLKVLCALSCRFLAQNPSVANIRSIGTALLTPFSDPFEEIASLFSETTTKTKVFSEWRNSTKKDKNVDKIMFWLEWSLSHTLKYTTPCIARRSFWHLNGIPLLLTLIESEQEDVQAAAIYTFGPVVASIGFPIAEIYLQDNVIRSLLNRAECLQESLQSVLLDAIGMICISGCISCWKAIVKAGGFNVLSGLARSMNRHITEKAAWRLFDLSDGMDTEVKVAIIKTGGAKALVDLLINRSSTKIVVAAAVMVLAKLAADDKCGKEVAVAGGVHVFVTLVQEFRFWAAYGLTNSVAYDESVSNEDAQALVQIVLSSHRRGGRKAGMISSTLTADTESAMVQFLVIVAWANLFSGRMDPLMDTTSEISDCIEAFLQDFSHPQLFDYAVSSSSSDSKVYLLLAPYLLIEDISLYRFSTTLIGKVIAMLQNPSPILRSCAAFALIQFTFPASKSHTADQSSHHLSLLKSAGVADILRSKLICNSDSQATLFFMKFLLWNLEHHTKVTVPVGPYRSAFSRGSRISRFS